MTTLMTCPADIEALRPCRDRWAVYRAAHPGDEAHPFASIIDSNGLMGALWVLDRLPGPVAPRLRLLVAAAYAERSLPLWLAKYPDDDRPAAAIRAARAWADAIGTPDEEKTRRAARDAAGDAGDAAGAAGAAAWAAERVAQARVLREIIASEEARNAR